MCLCVCVCVCVAAGSAFTKKTEVLFQDPWMDKYSVVVHFRCTFALVSHHRLGLEISLYSEKILKPLDSAYIW